MACTVPKTSSLHNYFSLLRTLPPIFPLPIRTLSTASITPPTPRIPPRRLPANIDSNLFSQFPFPFPPLPSSPTRPRSFPPLTQPPIEPPKQIKTYPPPPSVRKSHPFAIADVQKAHISSTLDPTGYRTRLFARDNPDAPRVGDILVATFTSGDPFSGVCLNIRRRGVDTAILLRNRVMMVGVEMWVKIYSPKVRYVHRLPFILIHHHLGSPHLAGLEMMKVFC